MENKKALPLSVLKETIIPPFTTAILHCSIKETSNSSNGSTPNDLELFEVSTIFHPKLQRVDALLSLEDRNNVPIPIYNTSSEDIELPSDSQIGNISLIKNPLQIFPLQIHPIDEAHEHLVNSLDSIEAISSDGYLNQEEKNNAFMNYLKTGNYTKSMSKEIEDSLCLTKMQLQNTQPQSWQQLQTQFNLQHLTPLQKQEALNMLKCHEKLFTKHDLHLGLTDLIEAKIFTDSSKPRITKYEPLPLNIRQNVRRIINQMHSFGLIRECQEPSNFVSNLLVTKSSDGEIKILLDGRLLNGATDLDPAPPQPSIEQLGTFSKAKFISSLNLSNAHLQIPIAAEHQADTAFYSDAHGKRYCFLRSPKTLKNSTINLQKLIIRIFSQMDIQKNTLFHGEDLFITSDKSFTDHLHTLGRVIELLQQANLKIDTAKLEIAKNQIEFLGIIWQKGRLSIPYARISGFKNIPPPNTPKKLKAVLEAISVYRNFIPSFDKYAGPLQEQADVYHKQFRWNQGLQESLNYLIDAIGKQTSLNSPDPAEPFYVQSDASNLAGAGSKGPPRAGTTLGMCVKTFHHAGTVAKHLQEGSHGTSVHTQGPRLFPEISKEGHHSDRRQVDHLPLPLPPKRRNLIGLFPGTFQTKSRNTPCSWS